MCHGRSLISNHGVIDGDGRELARAVAYDSTNNGADPDYRTRAVLTRAVLISQHASDNDSAIQTALNCAIVLALHLPGF